MLPPSVDPATVCATCEGDPKGFARYNGQPCPACGGSGLPRPEPLPVPAGETE